MGKLLREKQIVTTMSKSYFYFILILILPPFLYYTQVMGQANIQLINSMEKINTTPVSIRFQNSLEINNNGGHLQGIQYLRNNQNDYYVLSGSSDTYSYYSIVKIGKENLVISTNRILEKPFKHAGGFQINQHLMAIGVEDNEAKNKSKVFIFQINDPEKPPKEPLAVIDRIGTEKRATAGCVGIVTIREQVLVVVGDWDTKHLDFYRIDRNELDQDGATLEMVYTLDSRKMDKSGWIDENWLSYQNINFVKGATDNFFLAGMTSGDKGENVLDLFEIESEDFSMFKLKKIYSKKFNGNKKTKFRWGSGIHFSDDMEIKVLSCGENIQDTSVIHIYQ